MFVVVQFSQWVDAKWKKNRKENNRSKINNINSILFDSIVPLLLTCNCHVIKQYKEEIKSYLKSEPELL